MMPGNRFFMEPLRSLAFGSIGAAYVLVGSSLQGPARSFLIQNFTDASLIFSWGNDIDHFILPANSQFLYDLSANKTHKKENLLSANTSLYVKEESVSPTSGNVYFSVFCGEGSLL